MSVGRLNASEFILKRNYRQAMVQFLKLISEHHIPWAKETEFSVTRAGSKSEHDDNKNKNSFHSSSFSFMK
jgi:hypothetical protein